MGLKVGQLAPASTGEGLAPAALQSSYQSIGMSRGSQIDQQAADHRLQVAMTAAGLRQAIPGCERQGGDIDPFHGSQVGLALAKLPPPHLYLCPLTIGMVRTALDDIDVAPPGFQQPQGTRFPHRASTRFTRDEFFCIASISVDTEGGGSTRHFHDFLVAILTCQRSIAQVDLSINHLWNSLDGRYLKQRCKRLRLRLQLFRNLWEGLNAWRGI